MSRRHLLPLLCTAFSLSATIPSVAQSIQIGTKNVVAVKDSRISKEGDCTIKTFELEALEESDYYACIWTNSALCTTGKYAPLSVAINGKAIADIDFTEGNWQPILLNGGQPIHLRKGTNTFALSCPASIVPNVECINVSSDLQSACISSNKYTEYLEKAKSGQQNTETLSAKKSIRLQSAESGHTYVHESIPLKYSFHTSCYFSQNQDVHFATSGTIPHAVDIFYYGSEKSITLDSLFSKNDVEYANISTASIKSVNNFPTTQIPHKITMVYTPATADEIQGLNWKRISQCSASDKALHATDFTINFHKDGFYMIKLRSLENGTLGIADLTIDDMTYGDVPVYYAAIDCAMPADSNYYSAAALRGSEPMSDPMLFVEGNDGLRVVGYSDDNSGTIIGEQISKGRDAFIRQTYNIDTQRLHVCNYSSENPEGTCDIIGGVSDKDNQEAERSAAELSIKPYGKYTNGSFATSISNSSIPPSVNDAVRNDIYDISGKRIVTSSAKGTEASHSVGSGIHIIQTTTKAGKFCKKNIVPQP